MAGGKGGTPPFRTNPNPNPNRRMFNDGLRNTTSIFPDVTNRNVSLTSIEPDGKFGGKWVVTLNIDGWPHSVVMWGDDEMHIFQKVQKLFDKLGARVVDT